MSVRHTRTSNALARNWMAKPLLGVLLSAALAACGGGGGGNSPPPAPANRAPIAAISIDQSSGAAPLTVVMSSSGSTDPDGTISSYRFTLNGNTLGTTASVQHTFTEPGAYGVTLTVTDNNGATGSATATVTVNAAAALTGVFIDGSVKGLAYRTATQSGLTDASGEFRYLAGETVTFSIGSVELGSAPGAARVTPFDFFGMDPPSTEAAVRAVLHDSKVSDFDRVANIARLLVSLDTDRDLHTGIDLTGWNETLAGASLSFDSDLYRFAERGEDFEEPGEFEKFARVHRVNRKVSRAQPLVYLYRALGMTVPAHVRDSRASDFGVDGSIDSRQTFVYDADGYLRSSLYEDYDAAGNVSASASTTWTYDTAGNPLTRESAGDNDGNDTVDHRSSRVSIYDADGQPQSQVAEYDEDGDDEADVRVSESYKYDAAGRLLTFVYEYDLGADDDATPNIRDTVRSTYDDDGRLLMTLVSEYEAGDGDDTIDSRRSQAAVYDDDGRLRTLVTEFDADADGMKDSWTIESYTYDGDGHRATLVAEYHTDADGLPDSTESQSYTYDADGRPSSFASESDVGADGSADARSSTSYTYDADGRLQARVAEYDADADPNTPNLRESFGYTYDADGYPLIELHERDNDGDGNPEHRQSTVNSYAEIVDGLSHLIANPPDVQE